MLPARNLFKILLILNVIIFASILVMYTYTVKHDNKSSKNYRIGDGHVIISDGSGYEIKINETNLRDYISEISSDLGVYDPIWMDYKLCLSIDKRGNIPKVPVSYFKETVDSPYLFAYNRNAPSGGYCANNGLVFGARLYLLPDLFEEEDKELERYISKSVILLISEYLSQESDSSVDSMTKYLDNPRYQQIVNLRSK